MATLYPATGPWTEAALWSDRTGAQPLPDPELLFADLPAIAGQRLIPLLLARLGQSPTVVDPAVFDELEHLAFRLRALTAAVTSHGSEAVQALGDAGIPLAVTKGPGLAACYPDFMQRPFSDIDILVPAEAFPVARDVLSGLGYREPEDRRQPWPSFDRLCREGVNLRSPGGGSIDLHHHVPPWFWASQLTAEQVIAEARRVSAFGAALPCASPEHNLLIAALHIVSDRNRPGASLLIWRDIAEAARSSDPGAVARAAEACGLRSWLVAVLRALPDHARPQAVLDALSGGGNTLRGSRRLSILLSRNSHTPVLVTQPLRLPAANGLLYAAGLMFPSPSFLRRRYGPGWTGYLRWWGEHLPGLPARP